MLTTITPAVPKPEPLAFKSSKFIRTDSQIFFGSIGVLEPPGTIAFKLSHPPSTPSQCFSTNSLSGIPISSSIVHGLLTLPDMQKIFVPVLFSAPIDLNQSGPLLKIVGTTAIDSTLLIVVGIPYKPTPAGKGGFNLGCPFFPSKLSKRAVSSPHM